MQPLRQYQSHPRNWRENLYVYPVISRRSGGLSIGINLNPDTACNFDCVYCQVDRSITPRVRDVDPERVRHELQHMIDDARSGAIFDDAAFSDVSAAWRHVRDIAFSGDGEPTTCPCFGECVDVVAAVKRKAGLDDARIVLITDACYLTRPNVEAALAVMDVNGGVIWAKLAAGTEEYYRAVNRPNYPLHHVLANMIAAARIRPIVLQSLFMRLAGNPPGEAELVAYCDRINEIVRAGGQIQCVQVYTVARPPAEQFVSSLHDDEIDHIVRLVRGRTSVDAVGYYGSV